MSNPVGSLSHSMVYETRLGMTDETLTIMERSRTSGEPWELEESKPNMEALERGVPGLYLSCFDMLLTEDTTWLVKVSDASQTLTVPMARMAPQEEPEQCPVIDSQEQGLSPGLEGQEEERSLEQVQSLVVGEVLKDIETACKLLNITPGRITLSIYVKHRNNVFMSQNMTGCEWRGTEQYLTFRLLVLKSPPHF